MVTFSQTVFQYPNVEEACVYVCARAACVCARVCLYHCVCVRVWGLY